MIRTSFASWLGLVVAPFVVLGAQSLNYALVQVACAQRSTLARDAASQRAAFFSLMAMLVAALSALIQLMMWFPQWLLSPCR
ncbi:hypothetical protein [Paraburkholderia sp. SIMBA_054]|uniref:hypothetical protein n=1 Tax=Paraburkholderia sp. SIMBA_054 TaxID=3085795 RepID=UPI00397942D9